LYDLCDELGLYVIDEADLECHGFYDAAIEPMDIPAGTTYEETKTMVFGPAAEYTSNKPSWEKAYVDRVEQLIRRDRNHSSIIIWSLGNESFYGRNHAAMAEYIRKTDPSRLIHYEGDIPARVTDMFSYMYTSVDKLKEHARKDDIADDGSFSKPIVLCEYGHAMGNGPGWLHEYQEAFRTVPRLQGGFIWEWANHGLLKTDETGTYYAYGGDFGDFPNDSTFVMDGLLFSDHTPSPGLVSIEQT
jgi:beta-galactosidase